MNQKRYWICLSVLAGLSMVAWAADAVTIKGMPYPYRLSGYENFQVEMVKSSGAKRIAPLLDVTNIECKKYPEFSQAEAARTKKKYAEALNLYEKAASKSRLKWLKALARDRSYQILVAQGEVGKATKIWLDMVDSSTDQKTALDWVPVLSGTPSKRKAGDAIRTLQSKAKKLKNDPKNKAYRASVLTLLAQIQTAIGDASGAEKTQAELVAAGGGKTTKKGPVRKKRPALSRGKNDSRLNPARDLVDAKNYDEAIAEIGKVFINVPYREKPAAYVLLGNAMRGKYQAEGKKDKSLLTQAGNYFVYAYALEKNAEEKPSIGEALYGAMQVCIELGDTTGASAAAQALEQICGEDNPWVKKSKLKQNQ